MKLNALKNPNPHKKKRIGRGISAGGGKTAGRGTKGQKSRTGHHKSPVGFEGGQMPLKQRLPKLKGYQNRGKKNVIVKLSLIDKHFRAGEVISSEKLIKAGIIKKVSPKQKIKVLFDKESNKLYKLKDLLVSKNAQKYFSKESEKSKPEIKKEKQK